MVALVLASAVALAGCGATAGSGASRPDGSTIAQAPPPSTTTSSSTTTTTNTAPPSPTTAAPTSTSPPTTAPPPTTTAATTTTALSPTTTAPPLTTAPPTTVSPPTTTAPVPADIESIDLASVTFQVPCPSGEEPVAITPSQGPAETPNGAVQLDDLEPVYGDVTGDGRPDAVVRLGCFFVAGGNAYGSSVALVISDRDGAHQLGPAVEGYSPVLVGSTVGVARAVYADDDAGCCPSTIRHVPLSFDGDQLVEGSEGTPLTSDDVATTTGIGGLQVGQPYGQLAATLGQAVVVYDDLDSGGECVSVSIEGGPDLYGLGDAEHLGSVEFDAEDIRTISGLGIGSTEAEVYDAFGDQVTSEPHTYLVPDGHYLTYTPVDDPEHVIVFDTDGTTVTHFRVGESSWAHAIEGCL